MNKNQIGSLNTNTRILTKDRSITLCKILVFIMVYFNEECLELNFKKCDLIPLHASKLKI